MHPDHNSIATHALVGVVIHAGTFIVQVIFFAFTFSLALISDTIHVAADGLALFVLWLTQKQAIDAHQRGDLNLDEYYHRGEIIGTITIGALLCVTALSLLPFAVIRVSELPDISSSIWIPGVLGFVGNIVVLRLMQKHHKHRTVLSALSHIGLDVLGSIGVVTAGVLIWGTGKSIFDPVISFFIIGLMIFAGFGFMFEAAAVLRNQNNAANH